jgi:fermentation-respiration switch protein FrsA (DUF1100 family)
MKTWLKIIGAIILVLALAAMGGVLYVARSNALGLVHTPAQRPGPEHTPKDFGMDYEDVSLTTSDGLKLAAWYVPSKNGAAVIVQHGYRNTREGVIDYAQFLSKHAYGVLMIEARGHGVSEGETISFGKKEALDIRAGLDYLLARQEFDPERIGALGVSQGGVTILLATAQYPEIHAVVADSAYASLQEEIAVGVKTFTGLDPFPFAPLIQFFAESEAHMKASEVAPINHIAEIAPRPLYLIQGGADTVIPTNSGQRLYDAAGNPKELWFDEKLGHSQAESTYPAEYEKRIVGFFDEYLLGKGN